jgi:hypothetical protein
MHLGIERVGTGRLLRLDRRAVGVAQPEADRAGLSPSARAARQARSGG